MPERPASLHPLIVIPARLAATRLPGKPLADIGGLPMIVHVVARALQARVGPVVVAAAEPAIAEAVERADIARLIGAPEGAVAVALTDPALPSGSDRVWAAVRQIDPRGDHDVIVNLQGDMPTLDPRVIGEALAPLADPAVDIATLVAEIRDPAERDNLNVVKAILEFAPGARIGRAVDFVRTPPAGPGPCWHHIGIYAYRRAALARFVALTQSAREVERRLEQMRALDAGMRIDAAVVDTVPLGVDTPADLDRARALLRQKA
jgi:3-deoxy-manno-octulosonate cytidylyltransferase (CMP-KDO synthetase)